MPMRSLKRARGRPRRGESTVSRQTIVHAAIDEFSTAGFRGARMQSIATAAGCDRALLYFYFNSKADLFQAALDEVARQRETQMHAQPRSLGEGLIYWFRQNQA